jgi:hypothetical protein
VAESFYTSYETSRALKAAGAEQRVPAGGAFWSGRERLGVTGRSLTADGSRRLTGYDEARAFRADEILAELERLCDADTRVIVESPAGCITEWRVRGDRNVRTRRKWFDVSDASLVEAAAACWLAVLGAKP